MCACSSASHTNPSNFTCLFSLSLPAYLCCPPHFFLFWFLDRLPPPPRSSSADHAGADRSQSTNGLRSLLACPLLLRVHEGWGVNWCPRHLRLRRHSLAHTVTTDHGPHKAHPNEVLLPAYLPKLLPSRAKAKLCCYYSTSLGILPTWRGTWEHRSGRGPCRFITAERATPACANTSASSRPCCC